MKKWHGFVSVVAPLVLVLSACETSKSSNPLTATIAGPIPGVDISAPMLVAPNGARIDVNDQPVTLTIENADSNGPRPLKYTMQVAIDAGFTNKVFEREGIAPGDGGRTSLRLPEALATGRSYYWRARAQDGANTGPYSAPASFEVFTPIRIEAPVAIAPAPNEHVASLRPRFTWANAARSGPVGSISYYVEVSDNEAFAPAYPMFGPVPEQPGQTGVDSPRDGAYSHVYYWHVRASDGSNTGPWSITRAFATQAAPAPLPPAPIPAGPSRCTFTDKFADNTCFIAQARADLLAQHVNLSGECGAFRIIQLAVSRMGNSAGYKRKGGTSCNGYSIKSVMFPDGADFLVLISPGTTNGPVWTFSGYSDRSIYGAP